VEHPATFAGLEGGPAPPSEGNRLLRIVRRDSGSVVAWRRAQIALLSAQGMSPPKISEVVLTDPDAVRDVIHNFNRDGFDSLYPCYAGGRPRTFTLPERQRIKKIALSACGHRAARRPVPALERYRLPRLPAGAGESSAPTMSRILA